MARQRIGDRILMIGTATRAAAPLNQLLGDDGRAHQHDSFDHTFTSSTDATEGGAAVGTVVRSGYHLGVVNPSGTPTTTAGMANCSTARFGWRGVVRTRARGEGFALEVKQFLVRLMTLGLDGGQLGLSVSELGTQLHLGGLQVGEQAAQLITLGTNGVEFQAHSGQFGLAPREGAFKRIRSGTGRDCGFRTHTGHATRSRINGALEQQ
jgi:hypothetical protein